MLSEYLHLLGQDLATGCRDTERLNKAIIINDLIHRAVLKKTQVGGRVVTSGGAGETIEKESGGDATTITPSLDLQTNTQRVLDAVKVINEQIIPSMSEARDDIDSKTETIKQQLKDIETRLSELIGKTE